MTFCVEKPRLTFVPLAAVTRRWCKQDQCFGSKRTCCLCSPNLSLIWMVTKFSISFNFSYTARARTGLYMQAARAMSTRHRVHIISGCCVAMVQPSMRQASCFQTLYRGAKAKESNTTPRLKGVPGYSGNRGLALHCFQWTYHSTQNLGSMHVCLRSVELRT